jgi:hypothetical protein
LTFNAEVTQRIFLGGSLVHRHVPETQRSQPSEGGAENELAEWRQLEVPQRLVRRKMRVNKKMVARALPIGTHISSKMFAVASFN